ncbi:MAG TPA: glycosyltransferase family 4 protein [Terriglobia bacterium]|nr:glycosyltransferase family 4 protein [Terriglobia bacterium]
MGRIFSTVNEGPYKGAMAAIEELKILTINWHTAYLYNLSKTGHRWSVLKEWEDCNRPFPANFERIDWPTARRKFPTFDIVIGHSIWLDIGRFLPYCLRYHKPYIQVIHGRRARGGFSRSRLRRFAKQLYSNLALQTMVKLGLIHIVFISSYARSDWGLDGTTITQGIPLDEMGPYEGTEASLLTVGNFLHREHFAFDDLMRIGTQVPVKIVGRNPQIPGCRPSKDWSELRAFYRSCRAYLNLTREPEDGHNLAMLEAMASGMPVISLRHPSTPIQDGENGFLVENSEQAVERARLLLADLEFARKLGKCARETVARNFSSSAFRTNWNNLLFSSIGRASVPPAS